MKHLKYAILGSLLLVLLIPAATQANTVIFEEDFSGGFEKWEATRDDGHFWSIVDGKAQALIEFPSTVTEMVPKDIFWDPNWKNLEYSLEFTPAAGIDKNISFVFQNLQNWYELHFVDYGVYLTRLKNGVAIFGQDFPFVMTNNHTYAIKIRFVEGKITVFVDGQQIFDVADWTFNNNFGKIGLKAGTGWAFPTQVLYDNIVVTLLDSAELSLTVPLFKQHDNRWKDDEYDSAKTWSAKPTIHRWGCALTSAAMILQHYGLSQLPTGQELNPGTLNTWLKSQVDGYIGEGALNWQAITRLTRIVSDQTGLPKLEYRRHETNSLQLAKAEIQQQKPVVLQINGHFLVGDGISNDGADVLIKDPAYSYHQFSQHQTELLSTRTFQPSQTDLSYILMTYKPGLDVNITDQQGKNIATAEIFEESLTDHMDNSGESTESQMYLQIPKPANGNYLISVSQQSLARYQLQIFTYDIHGNPTVLNQEGMVGTEPIQLTLQYSNQGSSSLKQQTNWSQFYRHFRLAKRMRGFRLPAYCRLLESVIIKAEKAPVQHRWKYLRGLKLGVKAGRAFMAKQSYEYLQQQLNTLE